MWIKKIHTWSCCLVVGPSYLFFLSWPRSFSSRPIHVALARDMRDPALLAWALVIHAAAIQDRSAVGSKPSTRIQPFVYCPC